MMEERQSKLTAKARSTPSLIPILGLPSRPLRHRGKSFSSLERGTSAVEFSASVLWVVLMFLGMLQFGAYLWASSVVENAARHGARMGSVSQGCAPCEASAAASAALAGQPLIQSPGVAILAPGGVVGSTVKIRVSARIPLFLPAGESFGLEKLTTVQAEATFRQEGW
jgi:hypothetical protein